MKTAILLVVAAQLGIPQISPTEPFEKTLVIDTSGTNLSSDSDRKQLERRVQSAVKSVCEGDARTYQSYKEVKDCELAAWQDAARQLNELDASFKLAQITVRGAAR